MDGFSHKRGPLGIRLVLEVAAERGVAPERCLAGTGLTPGELDTNDVRVAAGHELHATRNLALALGDPPGLGVEIGRRVTPARLGIWGFAALTSPTLADVILLGTRFSALTPLFLKMSIEVSSPAVRIVLDDSVLPADVHDVLLERDLAACAAVLPALLGELPGARVETRLQGPRLAALRELGSWATITGGHTHNVLAANIRPDQRLPQADPETWRVLKHECEQLLFRRHDRDQTAAAIRSRLLEHPAAMPTLEQVADEMHLEQRTVRRHLTAEGTSFRALRDEVRQTLAVELLTELALSVTEVAHRLGYADHTSFTHAFTRWYGTPPSEYSVEKADGPRRLP